MSFLLAATFPERVRSLVTFGSSPIWRADPLVPGSEKAAAFADDVFDNIDGLLANADGWHYWVGPEHDLPELRAGVAKIIRSCVSPRDARQVMEMMRRIDVRETLPLVSCPTLVVGAKDDAIGPPEAGLTGEDVLTITEHENRLRTRRGFKVHSPTTQLDEATSLRRLSERGSDRCRCFEATRGSPRQHHKLRVELIVDPQTRQITVPGHLPIQWNELRPTCPPLVNPPDTDIVAPLAEGEVGQQHRIGGTGRGASCGGEAHRA